MISCRAVSFAYPDNTFGLRVKSLTIKKGETVAVVGPSGCGKTTLVNLVSGIYTPQKGEIEIDGVEISKFGVADRQDFRIARMGLIFQEFELLAYLNVLENIMLPYRLNPILAIDEKVLNRAKRLAIAVGLEDRTQRFPNKLSQGERQRVAVCRALITEPKVLLCDEPTANLDPKNRDAILDMLFKYCKQSNTTLLMVTHDYEILSRFDTVIDSRTFMA